MNTKKIWLFAVLFGLVMSVSFFILTSNNGNTKEVNETTNSEDQVEEENENQETTAADLLNIANEKRALSIAVDEVQGVSGFVRPGDFVDVVIVQPAPEQGGLTSSIVLENVRVLAVGRTVKAQSEAENYEPYNMVTVEVSPAEGVNLALEKERGTVTLMLRGINEEAQ